jgi:hypothetical protein
MAEKLRVAAFTTIEMEDGDWQLQPQVEDVLKYKAVGGSSSLTVKHGATTVFDQDFKADQVITIVGNVIHLPEGAFGR